MPVAFDNVASTNAVQVSSLSYSVTVGSGSNRALVIGVGYGQASGGSPTVSTVTVGTTTQTATKQGSLSYNSSNGRNDLWTFLSPSSGAQTITITLSSQLAGTLDAIESGTIALTGVGSFGSFFSTASNVASSSASLSITGTSTTSLVIDCISDGSGGESPGASQTQRWKIDQNGAGPAGNAAGSTVVGTTGTVTNTWALISDVWGLTAIEAQAIATVIAGGPSIPIYRVRLRQY